MDQVSLPDQEAFRSIAEIAGHLVHPNPIGFPCYSRDFHPPTRHIDQEEYQEPCQSLVCRPI